MATKVRPVCGQASESGREQPPARQRPAGDRAAKPDIEARLNAAVPRTGTARRRTRAADDPSPRGGGHDGRAPDYDTEFACHPARSRLAPRKTTGVRSDDRPLLHRAHSGHAGVHSTRWLVLVHSTLCARTDRQEKRTGSIPSPPTSSPNGSTGRPWAHHGGLESAAPGGRIRAFRSFSAAGGAGRDRGSAG
jgi:hypothetical protein